MLASSNQTSFAVFTYKCGLLNWIRNKASIGFSSGEDFFFNHPLSKLPNVNNIACLNQILTPWSNVVFNSKNGKCMNYNDERFIGQIWHQIAVTLNTKDSVFNTSAWLKIIPNKSRDNGYIYGSKAVLYCRKCQTLTIQA